MSMRWWPFRKRQTLAESGIFRGMTDYHAHLLPGVDDGVQTVEESLEILRLYEQLGIREVWCTPHVMEDIPNTTAGLRARFGQFQARYAGPVRLHLAAEYMLDNLFKERLAHRDLLPLGAEGDHLLVETSYFNPPMDLYGMVEKIKSAGFIPVLAHPERYVYMAKCDYQKLRSKGILFQINLFSLVGYYGHEAQQKVRYLLEQHMCQYCGTDIHAYQSIKVIRGIKNKYKKLLFSDLIKCQHPNVL